MPHNNLFAAVFDLIHCNIWGPCHVPTHDGMQYFLTIVDDCSRFTWTYLLKHKSEASGALIRFITLVKTQIGKTMKQIRFDNARVRSISQFP